MTAVLLQAIKEQQLLIDGQRALIDNQTGRIERQQSQIDDLLRAVRDLTDPHGSTAILPATGGDSDEH